MNVILYLNEPLFKRSVHICCCFDMTYTFLINNHVGRSRIAYKTYPPTAFCVYLIRRTNIANGQSVQWAMNYTQLVRVVIIRANIFILLIVLPYVQKHIITLNTNFKHHLCLLLQPLMVNIFIGVLINVRL